MPAEQNQLSPKPPDDPCWLFPAELYGPQRNARAFARQMARKGVASGTWRDAWQAVEQTSVLEQSGDIWISDTTRQYTASAVLWRLKEVHVQLAEVSFDRIDRGIYLKLTGEMLDQLWFCLAIASDYAWRGSEGLDEAGERAWMLKVMQALVGWLPELYVIKRRIANGISVELAEGLSHLPLFRNKWAFEFFVLCHKLGYDVTYPGTDPTSSTISEADLEWDLLDELTKKGVVIVEQGRTRFVGE